MRFWGNPKPPRKKKGTTVEAKTKDWANQQLLKMARTNPAIANLVIAKATGIDPAGIQQGTDPLVARQTAVKQKVTDLALKRIDEDPQIQDQVTQEELARILGGSDRKRRYSHDDEQEMMMGPDGDLDTTIEQIEKLEAIKQKLGGGGGNGFSEVLKDPQVLVAILTLLQQTLGGKNGHSVSPPRVYCVETPEGLKELTAEQYQQYLIQRKQVKLAAPSASLPPAAPPSPTVPAPTTPIPTPKPQQAVSLDYLPGETAPPPGTLKITDWRDYFESEPAVFVAGLKERAELGDQDANFTLMVLASKTADEIISILKSLTVNSSEEVKETVQILSKQWLEKAIEIVKLDSTRKW